MKQKIPTFNSEHGSTKRRQCNHNMNNNPEARNIFCYKIQVGQRGATDNRLETNCGNFAFPDEAYF